MVTKIRQKIFLNLVLVTACMGSLTACCNHKIEMERQCYFMAALNKQYQFRQLPATCCQPNRYVVCNSVKYPHDPLKKTKGEKIHA